MFTNKTTQSLVFITMLLISLASPVFSQTDCSFDLWVKNARAQWWNNNVPENFALSKKQVKKLNKIRSKFSKKIQPQQDELWDLKAELSRYLGQSEIDIRRIKSFRKKIYYLEKKISDLQQEARDKITKILTKEQKKYFYDGGYGWWGVKTNWWHTKKNTINGHEQMSHHGCY